MRLVILGGGLSPEREVSLRSAGAVAAAAKLAGYEVLEIDPKYDLEKLDEIDKDAIVFPILHGQNGEDGVIQKKLETLKMAYLGSTSEVSKNCFDKWATRIKLTTAGLPMAPAELVDKTSYFKSELSKKPHVLKVVNGGSSIGTMIVRHNGGGDKQEVNEIFEMEDKAVLEELVIGTEITVPILGSKALPIVEIIPPPKGDFDYENKYNGKTQEIVPARHVSLELQNEAQKLAEKAHNIMGCRHLSRVDLMIDARDNIYILEVNTMPGLTAQSLYPKAARVSGLSMAQLVNKFVELVRQDYSK